MELRAAHPNASKPIFHVAWRTEGTDAARYGELVHVAVGRSAATDGIVALVSTARLDPARPGDTIDRQLLHLPIRGTSDAALAVKELMTALHESGVGQRSIPQPAASIEHADDRWNLPGDPLITDVPGTLRLFARHATEAIAAPGDPGISQALAAVRHLLDVAFT